MSKTRGEGRSPSEKTQRVFETSAARRARIAKLQAETLRWAKLAGPVTTTKKEDKP
jgi:hypothetical protein